MDNDRRILECYDKANEDERMLLFLKYRYLRDVFEIINRKHSLKQTEIFLIDDPILHWSLTRVIRDTASILLESIQSIFGKR